MQIKYKFYATLLDSFAYYLSSDREEAFQEFIDKLNRVPFVSEAASKGTAFNELVDLLISGIQDIGQIPLDKKGNLLFTYDDVEYAFNPQIVSQIAGTVRGSLAQVFVNAVLPTSKGNVELYGYADYVRFYKCTDLKTTRKYDFPKYLHAWQSKVYPYCFNQNGVKIDMFEYLVTDFSNIYKEEYVFNPEKDIVELQGFCEQLIDFIEQHRSLITSTDPKVIKLFNQVEQSC